MIEQSSKQARVILITGGSRGIGAATARLAAAEGYAVAINFRLDGDAASELAKELTETGARAIPLQGDVSVEDEVVALFDRAEQELGCLTALVNNAAILEQQMPLAEMDAERINRVLRTNVSGSFLCAREAVRRMSTRRGGEPGRVDRIGPTLPMGRGGYPDEVARAILWLLSDQASYTTGSFIDVSGGR